MPSRSLEFNSSTEQNIQAETKSSIVDQIQLSRKKIKLFFKFHFHPEISMNNTCKYSDNCLERKKSVMPGRQKIEQTNKKPTKSCLPGKIFSCAHVKKGPVGLNSSP